MIYALMIEDAGPFANRSKVREQIDMQLERMGEIWRSKTDPSRWGMSKRAEAEQKQLMNLLGGELPRR